MKSLTEFMAESKVLETNTQIDHIEDLLFTRGIIGAHEAIDILRQIGNALFSIGTSTGGDLSFLSVKWDGSPSIVAGTDSRSGRFFVATKSAFNKTPKIAFTEDDIDRLYGHSEDLRETMKICLRLLPDCLPSAGIYQGDVLFATERHRKREVVSGEDCITFRTNVITYVVPVASELGEKLSHCDLGIVWHTKYSGDVDSMRVVRTKQILRGFTDRLGVWNHDPNFADLVSVNHGFTLQEYTKFLVALNEANASAVRIRVGGKEFFNYTEMAKAMKTYINSLIRDGAVNPTTIGFAQWLLDTELEKISKFKLPKTRTTKEIEARKRHNEVLSNISMIGSIFETYLAIIKAKLLVIPKLNELEKVKGMKRTTFGFETMGAEGFVAVMENGTVVKLVDRIVFSRFNFSSNDKSISSLHTRESEG